MGLSMLPTIRPGDSICILPYTDPSCFIRKNDLIVFFRDDKIVCHRVLGILKVFRKAYYLEKGDNNRDTWFIREPELLGKVIKINDRKEIPSSKAMPGPLGLGLNILKSILSGLSRK